MGRTYYCARCLNSFARDLERCPNLGCGVDRPELGWGDLLGPGDLVDRHYRVSERLAVGGAGITYRARETDEAGRELGPELAVKVLFQKQDGTFLKRLANEARVLQDLDHPHIVRSRGFVHRAGHPAYLVTLYERGGNLYDHVRHAGALDPAVAIAIAEQMLDALAMAHRRGVVHRDLKPQNVFLRELVARDVVPHVLVADFGIARVQGALGEGLTTAGTFLGTPEFAAIEQFKGLPAEPPADVYGAMAVLWYCLTGAPPVQFADRTDLVGCLRTLRERLPPRLPPLVPEPVRSGLDALFAHTLVPDPAQRWSIPTVLEALAELDPAISASPLPSAPLGTLTPDGPTGFPAAPPPPSPAPSPGPAKPAPASPPAPRPRLRDAPPAPPPPARSSLDDLFEPGAGEIRPFDEDSEPNPSLDDLLAPPPKPAAAAPPAVIDAAWETVSRAPTEPSRPGARDAPESARTPRIPRQADQAYPAQPDSAGRPTAAQPPGRPEEIAAPLPPWTPSDPQTIEGIPGSDPLILEALGRCPTDARGPLLAALKDPGAAVCAVGPSAPSNRAIGACVAIAELGLEKGANAARVWLAHADPDVRATAALAVAATGKAGQLGLLSRLTTDPDARVRLAAVHALRTLGDRSGRPDIARDWIAPLASDPDPRVKRAVSAR